jgi:hypothetical protein
MDKRSVEVLRTASNDRDGVVKPWRGTKKAVMGLVANGYLKECGMSVMPPHKIYVITDGGRVALINHLVKPA